MNTFKKYIILCFALLLMGLTAHAQNPDTITIKFGKSSRMEVYLQDREDLKALQDFDMEEFIEEIQDYFADSLATDEENLDSEKTFQITRRNGERIQIKVKVSGSQADTATTTKKQKHRPRRHVAELDVDFGLNPFFANGEMPNGTDYDLRLWGSRHFAFSFGPNLQLTKKAAKVPIFLRMGLGVAWHNFMFSNDVRIQREDEQVSFSPSAVSLRKSKLTIPYLHAPLMLQVGDNDRSLFRVAVGGYAGLRIGGYSKIVYQENGKRIKDKEHKNFHLQDFRYGLRTQIGIGRDNSIMLFANYDLNEIFRQGRGPALQAFSFGISL
ncbi:MAG: hypothetical protein ACFCUI_07575 [Bernardetiaceae bacterium]